MTSATDPRHVDALVDRTGEVVGERGKKVLQKLAGAVGGVHKRLVQADANAPVVDDRILLEKALNDVCANDEIEKFVVMLTSGVAWFTKDKAREQRIAEARKILNAYHA